MATIKDIAQKLGISPGTVSKGLNGAKDVGESLRHAILETAVELGYTKAKAKSRLCIFVENMEWEPEDSFGHEIVLGFRQAAFQEKKDVDVLSLSLDMQRQMAYDAFMLKGGYTGAFFLGCSLEDPWMAQFENTKFPTVLLDNFTPKNPMVSFIGTDSEEGMEMALRHLLMLGHEKIAFLDGSKGSFISDQRMAAYLRGMAALQLPIDPSLAVYGYFVAEAAAYHVPGFIENGATAILCGNDLIATGVLEQCRLLGLSVPEDISVIGFDDLPIAQLCDPPLSSIRQERLSLGKSGYFILRAIKNGVAFSKNLLRPSLSLRKSTALAKPRVVWRHKQAADSVQQVNPWLYRQYLQQIIHTDHR